MFKKPEPSLSRPEVWEYTNCFFTKHTGYIVKNINFVGFSFKSMTKSDLTGITDSDVMQIAFDMAPVGMCFSEDRIITLCNSEFEAMFGHGRQELWGQSLISLYPSPSEFNSVGNTGLPVMREQGTYSDERIMKRIDGTLFWCHVVGRALERSDPFASAIWMFEDISHRRPLVESLTARERDIARHLITGATSKQIGRALGVSHRTIEAHRGRLMKKIGAIGHGDLIVRLAGVA